MVFNYSQTRPDIGHEVAEFDDTMLPDCFHLIPSYEEADNPRYPFMVGRKGIGKTALFKIFLEREKGRYAQIVSLGPTDLDIAGFTEIAERYADEWNSDTQDMIFFNTWRMFLLINSMLFWYYAHAGKLLKDDNALIYEFLRDNDWIGDESITRFTKICAWVIDLIQTTVGRDKKKRTISDVVSDGIVRDPKFREAYKAFQRVVGKTQKPFLLMIDAVDENFNYDEGLHEHHVRYFRGLLSAVLDLAKSGGKTNLRIKAYVPTDIFDHTPHRDR